MKKLIYLVAGARPNFMKIAPIARTLESNSDILAYKIIHTGQHYDHIMSDVFFGELGIRKPDHHLKVGSGSHARQTAGIMVAFEDVCQAEKPDLVLVVGDVNSTLACSIVAKKLKIDVVHVEAGLRSRDMAMPEEVNRIVTDSITDLFFVTEIEGVDNLLKEGKPKDAVHFVGNVMIDNLLYQLQRLREGVEVSPEVEAFKRSNPRYAAVTLHRPSNVDDEGTLRRIMSTLAEIVNDLPILFPVHPRTKQKLDAFGIDGPGITMMPPLSYVDFLSIWSNSAFVLTDSGGLQEETTALGIPCLTLRENTERPITVSEGTNLLVGSSQEQIRSAVADILAGKWKKGKVPDLWDGMASERIVGVIRDQCC